MFGKQRQLFSRLEGTRLLTAFLLLTLCLSLWLGYQALDAARSHRRTAEGVLRDFAAIAVWEYSRRIQENLAYFNRRVFDDVPRSLHRRPPGPEVMENDLRYALRGQECRCRGLRERSWFFRVDLRDSSTVTHPRSVSPSLKGTMAREVAVYRSIHPEIRQGLIPVSGESPQDAHSLILYALTGEPDQEPHLAYGMVGRAEDMEELFAGWLSMAPVLPHSLVAGQPSDSLMEMEVLGPRGMRLFRTPTSYPGAFPAQDTLDSEFGSLTVRAGIRPDAAQTLVIGGLPRSRIPLLLSLMAITLGVGAAALIQIRREHRLARLRDDFISSVSHEFRTPLTQIRLFAELLDSDKLTTGEERKRSTGVINREARRLTHLVENTLQFSDFRRVHASPAGIGAVDINAVLSEVSDAFRPLAEARGTEVQIHSVEDLRVVGRRGGLHRILANLLDNALKYGPRGQVVRIRARATEDRVTISVQDQGPGIRPRDRRKIWDPYRRLEGDMAGLVQGSGIGLAVVAELSSLFGGRVWVEEGDPVGSRFVVELRRAREAPEPDRSPVEKGR